MNFRRAGAAASACAMAGLMMIGGAGILAYLTDEESASNTFTVGKVKIDLEEPNYPGNDSKEVKELVPNEPVKKDPQISNTGDNAAVFFMAVDSPVEEVAIVGDDGSQWTDGTDFYVKKSGSWYKLGKLGQEEKLVETDETTGKPKDVTSFTDVNPLDRKTALQEIFNYKTKLNASGAYDATVTEANEVEGMNTADWTQLDNYSYYVDAEGNKIGSLAEVAAAVAAETPTDAQQEILNKVPAIAAVRRIFVYDDVVAAGEKTNPVFDSVELKNVVEGDIDSAIEKMKVSGYGIQAAYLKDAEGQNILNFDEDVNDASNGAFPLGADKDAVEATGEKILVDYMGQNGKALDAANGDNNNADDLAGLNRTSSEMYLRVKMSVDDTDLNVDETANATAAVETNYDDVNYTFSLASAATTSTDDDGVISVDPQTGVITALKPGTDTVIVTASKSDPSWKYNNKYYSSQADAEAAKADDKTAVDADTSLTDEQKTAKKAEIDAREITQSPVNATAEVEITVKSAIDIETSIEEVTLTTADAASKKKDVTVTNITLNKLDASTAVYNAVSSNTNVAKITGLDTTTGAFTIERVGSGSAIITVTGSVDGESDTETITVTCTE